MCNAFFVNYDSNLFLNGHKYLRLNVSCNYISCNFHMTPISTCFYAGVVVFAVNGHGAFRIVC
jgi:hypothetical protein